MNIFIIAALTADGFIAKNAEHSPLQWRSKFDREFFISRTKKAGVVVMGYNTAKTMRRPMPERLNIVYSTTTEGFEGYEVTQKPPLELIKDLASIGYKEVAICGGSHTYTMFMEAGVVDKLYLTIEPFIFGDGIRLFKKDLDYKLKLLSQKVLGGDTLLLEYEVIK